MPPSSHPIIQFKNDIIFTLVTSSASDVDQWIKNTLFAYAIREEKSDGEFIIVDLDTKWRLTTRYNKHQKVAILQLSIGHSCLVFQLYRPAETDFSNTDCIPKSLADFFGDRRFCFVGKEVKTDARKLFEDYNLWVLNTKDLAYWAADMCDAGYFRRMGLNNLACRFLKQEMETDKKSTLSRWDARSLSPEQIKYAAIDAFVSYKLGVYFSTKTRDEFLNDSCYGVPPED